MPIVFFKEIVWKIALTGCKIMTVLCFSGSGSRPTTPAWIDGSELRKWGKDPAVGIPVKKFEKFLLKWPNTYVIQKVGKKFPLLTIITRRQLHQSLLHALTLVAVTLVLGIELGRIGKVFRQGVLVSGKSSVVDLLLEDNGQRSTKSLSVNSKNCVRVHVGGKHRTFRGSSNLVALWVSVENLSFSFDETKFQRVVH